LVVDAVEVVDFEPRRGVCVVRGLVVMLLARAVERHTLETAAYTDQLWYIV
jgi:hypothetical protein